MNILLVINTPGGSKEENTIALVPAEKLEGISLDAIDGKIVNADEAEVGETWDDQIIQLYKRLGLEEQTGWEDCEETKLKKAVPILPIDLAEYMNPEMPITVDRVVQIGWAV